MAPSYAIGVADAPPVTPEELAKLKAEAIYVGGKCPRSTSPHSGEIVGFGHYSGLKFNICEAHWKEYKANEGYKCELYPPLVTTISSTGATSDGRTRAGAADDGKCPCGKFGEYGPCSSEIVATVRGGDNPIAPNYFNICSNHVEEYRKGGWKTLEMYPPLAPSVPTLEEFKAEATYNGGVCPYHGTCTSTDIVAHINSRDDPREVLINLCREHAKLYSSYKTFVIHPSIRLEEVKP